jgi:hypothetical protein
MPDTRHFLALPPIEREAAIRRLAAAGQSDQTISAATGLSVEQIQCVLSSAQSLSAAALNGREP